MNSKIVRDNLKNMPEIHLTHPLYSSNHLFTQQHQNSFKTPQLYKRSIETAINQSNNQIYTLRIRLS